MAEHANVANYHHGDMPINEHAQTYHGVMGLFKWGALGVADLMIQLVVWFCTPAGFLPALIISIIVLVAGMVGLRGAKKAPAH